jgi:hypothetical protein
MRAVQGGLKRTPLDWPTTAPPSVGASALCALESPMMATCTPLRTFPTSTPGCASSVVGVFRRRRAGCSGNADEPCIRIAREVVVHEGPVDQQPLVHRQYVRADEFWLHAALVRTSRSRFEQSGFWIFVVSRRLPSNPKHDVSFDGYLPLRH